MCVYRASQQTRRPSTLNPQPSSFRDCSRYTTVKAGNPSLSIPLIGTTRYRLAYVQVLALSRAKRKLLEKVSRRVQGICPEAAIKKTCGSSEIVKARSWS